MMAVHRHDLRTQPAMGRDGARDPLRVAQSAELVHRLLDGVLADANACLRTTSGGLLPFVDLHLLCARCPVSARSTSADRARWCRRDRRRNLSRRCRVDVVEDAEEGS